MKKFILKKKNLHSKKIKDLVELADHKKIIIKVAKDNKNWKIFDVLLDGSISEVATKKSDFKKIIKEEGVSGLVKNLRIRNQF